MQLENEIRNIIEAKCEDYFLGVTDLSVSNNPKINQYEPLIAEYPRAISFGITLPYFLDNPFRISKLYKKTNCHLKSIASRLSHLLESKGYNAFSVPKSEIKEDGSFISLHNLAANMADMGKISKNGLIVTPQVGSSVNWGTVLTDAFF